MGTAGAWYALAAHSGESTDPCGKNWSEALRPVLAASVKNDLRADGFSPTCSRQACCRSDRTEHQRRRRAFAERRRRRTRGRRVDVRGCDAAASVGGPDRRTPPRGRRWSGRHRAPHCSHKRRAPRRWRQTLTWTCGEGMAGTYASDGPREARTRLFPPAARWPSANAASPRPLRGGKERPWCTDSPRIGREAWCSILIDRQRRDIDARVGRVRVFGARQPELIAPRARM